MRVSGFSGKAQLALSFCIAGRALAQLNITANTSDPNITYHGQWTLTQGLASHITSQTGATATFVFNGTSVAWRSTRSSRQGIERVTIDSQSWSVDTTYADESISGSPLVVFQIDSLQPTVHELIVTKVSAEDKVAVIWDFIYVPSNAAPLFNPSSSSTSSAPTSTTDNAAAGTTGLPTTPETKDSGSDTLKIGLSAAAGALGAILIALVGLIIWRRRRRASSRTLSVSAAPDATFKDEEQIMSHHTQDPTITIMSLPSSTEPSSYTPANTSVGLSSPSARFTALSDQASSPSDVSSSAVLSDGTGRREPPPSYIAPASSGPPSNGASGSATRPNDLAIFVESSSASIYGDINSSKGKQNS